MLELDKEVRLPGFRSASLQAHCIACRTLICSASGLIDASTKCFGISRSLLARRLPSAPRTWKGVRSVCASATSAHG
jgi:hypothetical protein